MAKNEKITIGDETIELNPNQKRFCELFAYGETRGNAVRSYVEAYNIDLSKQGAYNSARANASILLTNHSILLYIRSLYENTTLNDTIVDNELSFLISQSADFGSKLGAIREYNQLKTRIVKKIDKTTTIKGKPQYFDPEDEEE